MRLKKVRACDGACCRESPRWPNADGSDCIYRYGKGKENGGCLLMKGKAPFPKGQCPVIDMPAKQAFEETCKGWPQNSEPGRSTGGCCWQWVDGD